MPLQDPINQVIIDDLNMLIHRMRRGIISTMKIDGAVWYLYPDPNLNPNPQDLCYMLNIAFQNEDSATKDNGHQLRQNIKLEVKDKYVKLTYAPIDNIMDLQKLIHSAAEHRRTAEQLKQSDRSRFSFATNDTHISNASQKSTIEVPHIRP